MMKVLIQLTENDKRIIIALLLAVIIIFVLIGLAGMGIQRLMKWQGKKMDTLVHDAVITRVVADKKHLRRYGRKKNWNLFFKQAWPPLLVLIIAFLFLVIWCSVRKDFNYNLFDHNKTGFSTILYLWRFGEPQYYTKVFGVTVLAEWPALLNEPHFEVDAIGSYIFVPLFLIGAIWYLVAVLAFISRRIRLYKLCTSIFEKSLEGFNVQKGFGDQTKMIDPEQK